MENIVECPCFEADDADRHQEYTSKYRSCDVHHHRARLDRHITEWSDGLVQYDQVVRDTQLVQHARQFWGSRNNDTDKGQRPRKPPAEGKRAATQTVFDEPVFRRRRRVDDTLPFGGSVKAPKMKDRNIH